MSKIICEDYSNGLENFSIPVINDIDDEDIYRVVYLSPRTTNIPRIKTILESSQENCAGCSCKDDCSTPEKCECQILTLEKAPKNFTNSIMRFHQNRILERKIPTGIYECNKNCSCSKKCPNRLSQLGLNYQLQIFKTPTSGWSIKTLSSIPKGTFITTYIGQLLTDEHVAGITRILHSLKHARSDIVNNLRYLVYLSDIVSSKCPNLPKTSIIVSDASKSGNFARFFNHSCDPNMFAQYIFVDSHDMRLPEVGFFTRRDIKEGEELCWDYGYEPDENKELCKCGAKNCRGKIF